MTIYQNRFRNRRNCENIFKSMKEKQFKELVSQVSEIDYVIIFIQIVVREVFKMTRKVLLD